MLKSSSIWLRGIPSCCPFWGENSWLWDQQTHSVKLQWSLEGSPVPRDLAVKHEESGEGVNNRQGFEESWGYPRKQEQCGCRSSRPGERLGENILVLESEGWTLDPCREESGAGLGHLRVRERTGEVSAARIRSWKLGSSRMSGARGTTPGARRLKKGVGWKLILGGWKNLTVFQLLLISRIRVKGM